VYGLSIGNKSGGPEWTLAYFSKERNFLTTGQVIRRRHIAEIECLRVVTMATDFRTKFAIKLTGFV